MPSTVKVRVYEARDLPVMDKNTKLADAYVQVKLLNKQLVKAFETVAHPELTKPLYSLTDLEVATKETSWFINVKVSLV